MAHVGMAGPRRWFRQHSLPPPILRAQTDGQREYIDVIRFDELAVVLQSVCGELTIEGNGLKMSVLDTDKGIVSLDGPVDSIYYSEDTGDGKKRLFGRIFN